MIGMSAYGRVDVLSDTSSLTRFPGSQPISFALGHLDELEKREFVVLPPPLILR